MSQEASNALREQAPHVKLIEREAVHVKGKGKMKMYFLSPNSFFDISAPIKEARSDIEERNHGTLVRRGSWKTLVRKDSWKTPFRLWRSLCSRSVSECEENVLVSAA